MKFACHSVTQMSSTSKCCEDFLTNGLYVGQTRLKDKQKRGEPDMSVFRATSEPLFGNIYDLQARRKSNVQFISSVY